MTKLVSPLVFNDGSRQDSAVRVTQSPTPPPSPAVGELWLDTGSVSAPSTGTLTAMPGPLSRLLFFGHSLMAAGGAASGDRGWGSVLASMCRAADVNYAVGGAALAYDNQSTTGDGGWLTLLKNLQFPAHGTRWRGAWSSAATYYIRDGVSYGGNWYVWAANNAATNITPGTGGWLQVTGPSSPGASPYPPRPDVPVLFYGNNDLGFYKQWAVFQEALMFALTLVTASMLWDDNDPNIVYGGSWPARTTGTSWTGTGVQQTPAALAGQTVTINVPPEFPGGTVSLFGFFLLSPTMGANFYTPSPVTATVDGVAAGSKTFSAYTFGGTAFSATGAGFGAPTTDPQKNTPWVWRFEGLAAGAHTIVITLPASGSTSSVFIDGVAFEAYPVRQPVLLPSLIKPISYALWGTQSIGDADVDTWNNNIINSVLPHFPSVIWSDFGSSTLPKDQTFFFLDSVHLNDRGQGLLARKAYDSLVAAMQVWSSEQFTLVNGPDRVGTHQVWVSPATINWAIPANPDNTWIAPGELTTGSVGGTPYSGYCDMVIKALPGDWIDLGLYVTFNNEVATPYVDLVTIDTRSGAIANWISTRSGSSGNGMFLSPVASGTPEGRYEQVAIRWPYLVQEADVIYGVVTFRLYVKKVSGNTTVPKTILRTGQNSAWNNWISARNLGPKAQMLAGWAS